MTSTFLPGLPFLQLVGNNALQWTVLPGGLSARSLTYPIGQVSLDASHLLTELVGVARSDIGFKD